MEVIRAIWLTIMAIVSLIVLVGFLWLLRVAIDWWLDVDYVAKIKRWIDEKNH